MSTLREAAEKLLDAFGRWYQSPAPCPSGELLDAVDGLRGAVQDELAEQPSLEELLPRLDPERHVLVLRGAIGLQLWAAKLRRGDGAPEIDLHSDPADAIRSVLLAADLPVPAHSAPTEPPPDDASDDPPRSGQRPREA